MQTSQSWTQRAGQWINDRFPLAFLGGLMDEPIPGGARFSYVLGSATLFLCVIQVVTGVWQMLYYVPSVDHAYDSTSYLRLHVPFGWLMHGLHYWGAQAFSVVMGLHLIRVFVWGAYKKPRELTWIIGVLLLLVGISLMFTGALLPWDMLGYWAAEVGTSVAGTVPLVGDLSRAMLRGGTTVGQLTLSRFFVLHVMILPAVLAALIAVHLMAFRKQGSAGPWNSGQARTVGQFWPDQVFKDLLVAAGLWLLLVGLSAYVRAPFAGLADPLNSTHIPKPEWNFLFLYEALKAFKGSWEPIGTVVLPAVLLLLLLSLPFIDRRPERAPWKRPVIMAGGFIYVAALLVLTVMGGRGPDNALPASNAGPATAATGAATGTPAGVPPVELGKQLFTSSNCIACHAVNGDGATIAPDLAGETAKGRTKDWLMTQLVSPTSHVANSIMPPYDFLSQTQREALVAYLMSLKPEAKPEAAAGAAAAPAKPKAPEPPKLPLAGEQGPPGPAARMIGNVANGRVLFEADCSSCHGTGGAAGGGKAPDSAASAAIAPDLGTLGKGFFDTDPQAFADNIDRYIQHGSRGTGAEGAPTMAAFGDTHALTQAEIANLEAYILDLNGVDRAKIIAPGIAPKTFFLINLVVLGGAVLLSFAGGMIRRR